MKQSQFMQRVQAKRKEHFPGAFDLAYASFCALGYDKKTPDFFLHNASHCVEELREECWKEFQASEAQFTKEVLREESEKMDFSGLSPHSAISEFIGVHIADIYDLCLSNTQARRSRAGKEFEAIIEMLLIGCKIPYASQGNIGKEIFSQKGLGKMVDEVVPGVTHYRVNKRQCVLISAKTTLRERWQEVREEMDRTGAKEMFLATIDERISDYVLQQLAIENIVVVTTRDIKEKSYPAKVEAITFEDLLSSCLNLGNYWNSYAFTEEEKEEILLNYQKQYERNTREKPFVAKYAKEMIARFSK